MRRGGSLSENLRTKFYGSIYQHQFGYTLNLLPSCLKNGGHLSLMPECRFEQRGVRCRFQHDACFFERLSNMAMVMRNEVPARKSLAGQLADLVPSIEDSLQSIVRLRGEVPRAGFIPEPQMALGA